MRAPIEIAIRGPSRNRKKLLSSGESSESGGTLEVHEHLGRGHGQVFSGPDEERHAGPTPGVDLEAHGREGLDGRSRGDALLLPVPAKLAADHVFGLQRRNGAEHLDLLVPHPVRLDRDRRLHREVADDLQQMVLNDVSDRPGLVVELAAALNPETFGHGDLDAVDVVAVPDRLEERVREPEEEQVLDGLLAQVVVDAKDRGLREDPVERGVQGSRARQVVPERLLDHDASALRAPGPGQTLDDRAEEARRNRQIVRRMLRAAERLAKGDERRRVRVVAVDVVQESGQPGERRLVHAAELGEARARTLAKLIGGPARLRHPDDGHRQAAPADHALERGEDFLVGEIARGAEEHQRVRWGRGRAAARGSLDRRHPGR